MAGRKTQAAGLKLQLKMAGASGAIKQLLITPATGSDSPYFEALLGDLARQSGAIFVFDGGYWRLKPYRAIVDNGNDFVTKRAGNIQPQVVQELPLPEEPLTSDYTVLQDALVYLGQDPQRSDPQPFHIDPKAAQHTMFGELIASGWHTASLMMRLMVDHYLSRNASLGSPGVDELRWLKPVRPGDALSVRVTILETKRSRSKPDRGIVRSFV
jgi:hypothetical protein